MVLSQAQQRQTLLNSLLIYLKRYAHNTAIVTDDGTRYASFTVKNCLVIK